MYGQKKQAPLHQKAISFSCEHVLYNVIRILQSLFTKWRNLFNTFFPKFLIP